MDSPEKMPGRYQNSNNLHWYVRQMTNPWKALTVIILIFGAVVLTIGLGGLSFSSKLSNNFLPTPAISAVYDAYQNLENNNPIFVDGDTEAILMQRMDNTSVFSLDGTNISALALGQRIINAVNASVMQLDSDDVPIFRFRWYYSNIFDDHLKYLKYQYLFPNQTAMLIGLDFDDAAEVSDPFINAVVSAVESVQTNFTIDQTGWKITATGILTTISLSGAATGKGFGIVNGAGIPFIAIIFWFQVGSGILLLFPVIATGCALILAYGIGDLLATYSNLDIPAYQADIMLFLALALAIDYSFFLLTRVQEERQRIQKLNGATARLNIPRLSTKTELAVAASTMLRTSGEIVITSGSILVVTWLALAFFPVLGLNAIGYCSALTVFLCMILNLLLTPALLLLLGDCCWNKYAGFQWCGCCGCCTRDYQTAAYSSHYRNVAVRHQNYESPVRNGQLSIKSESSPSTKALTEGLIDTTPVAEYEQHRRSSNASNATFDAQELLARNSHNGTVKWNCYARSAVYLTKCPGKAWVPLLVVTIFIGLCIFLFFVQLQLAANIDFGDGAAATAYQTILEKEPSFFGGGFAIIVTLNDSSVTAFTEPGFFEAHCELAHRLQHVPKIVNQSIANVAFQPFFYSGCINASLAFTMLTQPTDLNNGYYYRYACGEGSHIFNTTSNKSATTIFSPSFNPFSTESAGFVLNVRDVLVDVMNMYPNLNFELYHPIVVEIDAESFVFGRLPWVFAGMMILIFILIAVVYRAAFVPIKLTVTLLLPIFAIYGLAAAVYQFGILDWTGLNQLSRDGSGGFSWLVPCSTAFLLIGLALDYDIFLFSRIYELRKFRLNTVPAIIEAMRVTGPVITGAGIIMALAFLGMLFNTNKFLNEFGWIMITGVLVDTFIVRTILVPAVLSMGGKLNWWPVIMPTHDGSSNV